MLEFAESTAVNLEWRLTGLKEMYNETKGPVKSYVMAVDCADAIENASSLPSLVMPITSGRCFGTPTRAEVGERLPLCIYLVSCVLLN
jgi:hypothetical protein